MSSTEIYVSCGVRSKAIAKRFLDGYAPNRSAVADEYPFPEFADVPESVYKTESEIIDRLVSEPSCSYSIYWDCEGSSEQVMLFFTADGHMIAGVGGPTSSFGKTLSKICDLVEGRFGYVTEGNCPPESFRDFELLCRKSSLPCIVDGKLINTNES
jgi:hypothetical protein